jgi:hypothetical protein
MEEYLELLVGFDAREAFIDFRDAWETQRVEQYLLKEDIVKPLSVDDSVWVSVFHVMQIQRPDWVGPLELWDSLSRLRVFIESEDVSQPYWIIAASQWATVDKKNALEKSYNIRPASPSPEWELLGYDVADDFLLSGLMNAGYWTEERKILSRRWASHLNQYHLFDDFDAATEFKSLTDERVREHSPFNVYGLYLVERVTAGG